MEFNKKKILRYLKAAMVLSLSLLFVFLIVKASLKQRDILCTKIVIDIKGKDSQKFINENDVLAIISNATNDMIINQKVSDIDLVKLEEVIENHNFIENVEVYFNFEGALKIEVVQKKPLYRIINNNNVSYYISEKAYRVPLSSTFTPRLIVATGNIPNVEDVSTEITNQNLWILVNFIQADPFWDAMIGQIEVANNGDFILYPKLKGHNVLLGSIEDLDYKLKKLKIFYQKALGKTDWVNYKQINLKYKGQIICSK